MSNEEMASSAIEEAGKMAKEVVVENEDALKEILAEALRAIVEGVAQAKDFILEELPDVIVQLLWWKGVEATVFAFLGGFGLYSIYKITRKYWHKHVEWNKESKGVYVLFYVTALIILGIIFLDWVSSFMTALQIAIAPKIYLIEYATELVK